MFPYKTSLIIDRKSKELLYLQLSNQFINLIKEGKLISGTKLIGTRSLAKLLKVHRKTIVACYEELNLQGWIESIPRKGTFVHHNLPLLQQSNFVKTALKKKNNSTGFLFYTNKVLPQKTVTLEEGIMHINDGVSDVRLIPTQEIARIYRRVASKKNNYKEMSYVSTFGNEKLRKVLVNYLNSTRGLCSAKDTILITRGSQMGIWLASKLLLKSKDIIVVGNTNYVSADYSFLSQKATIKRVAVDAEGIVTSQIESLCKKHLIKAVYVTSHHHHPTTVTLSAERRIHLLNLAKQYHFAIIEDDYDYDFNYNHAPILPLASHDTNNNVIYIGSICKAVAPVFRIGYLVAPKEFVKEAAKLRGFVDRQGDALLELTFAEFIKSGDLDRHIRKVIKIYKQRRDLFCKLLQHELGDFFQFKIPKGGMAVWVQLHTKYTWEQVAIEAKKHQLEIGEWQRYDLAKTNHNAIRIGFASYNKEEIYKLIFILKLTMKKLKEISL